jgi:hypothetical protein
MEPDADGFIIATQDEVKAAGRSVTIVGAANKPGILRPADHVGAQHREPAALPTKRGTSRC